MASLLNGTIHLVQFVFTINGTPVKIHDDDMATAVNYVQHAAVPISQYASEFGPNVLNVDGNYASYTIPSDYSSATYSTTSTQVTYGNPDLWQWLDSVANAQGWPINDSIMVLNPAGYGVKCSDIAAGEHWTIQNPPNKSLAYDGFAYGFVDIYPSVPFTLDDQADQFAGIMSHELAEMNTDPYGGNPEVCDPSPGHDFFDINDSYIQSSPEKTPAPSSYAFFINSPAVPAHTFFPIRADSGVLDVFYTGGTNVVYHSTQMDPGGWTGSKRAVYLGDSTTTAKQIVVGSNTDGRLEAFFVGTDDTLYHSYQVSAGGAWAGPYYLQTADNKAKQLAVGRNGDGRLELFYVGTDDVLYHNYQLSPGSDWGGEIPLQDSTKKAKQLAVAANSDGRLELFYVGLNDLLYHNYQTTAGYGDWSGEGYLDSSSTTAKQLAVGVDSDGRLELFYTGLDDVLYHDYQTSAGGEWAGQGLLDTPSNKAQQLSVAANSDGRLELFYIGTDGEVYHNYQLATSPDWPWSGELVLTSQNDQKHPTIEAQQIGAVTNQDGRLELVYIGTDNILYHVWQVLNPDGSLGDGWTGKTIVFGEKKGIGQ